MNEYVNNTINCSFRCNTLSDEEKEKIVSNYIDENVLELKKIAEKKKVLPVVGKLMISLGLELKYWQTQYDYFLNRNNSIVSLLTEIFQKFALHGIRRICVYENFGALLSAGSDIALYSSGDVDLYADVQDKVLITQVLSKFSYFPTKDDNDARDICTEYLNKENGIIRINVAWKPLIRYSIPIGIDAKKYFCWEQMGYYKDTLIRLPSPNTLLYMCFLRIAIHGYSRSPDIRLYIDTYNSTVNNPNWEEVLSYAKNDGVVTKFVTVAAIAQDLIGISVPKRVIEISKNDPNSKRILDITYDFKKHTLVYDPSGLKLLKVEAASDQRSVLAEVFCMLFPPRKWLEEYYMDKGGPWYSKYFNYYNRLF